MKDEKQINQMSPLTWAYIGDAVYELYVRNYLIDSTNLKPNNLHKEAIKYVKAKSQAEILYELQSKLTEKEQDIVRRTRNTRKSSFAKKFKCTRIYVCNSIGRFNRIFIFNKTKR